MRVMQISCLAFFSVDVSVDLFRVGHDGSPPGIVEVLHLAFEALAVFLLATSLWMGLEYEGALRRLGDHKDSTLTALRACFDDLVKDRFNQWALSDAERDVALLAFRGLRISEIADLRGTREGTVKAQMSSIFRKANVTTRAEFLALFMDEFLDIAAASTVSGNAEGIGPQRPVTPAHNSRV